MFPRLRCKFESEIEIQVTMAGSMAAAGHVLIRVPARLFLIIESGVFESIKSWNYGASNVPVATRVGSWWSLHGSLYADNTKKLKALEVKMKPFINLINFSGV